MTNKFVAFFATPRGQTTSGAAALTAASLALLAKYLPNSVLVEQTRDLMQLFKDGFPVSVSADTFQKINQVKTDLKLEEDVAKRIPADKAFTVFGFDVLHIGSATFRSGALLGIPINFSYKSSISEADKKKIVVGQKTVHWSSPEGIALESSLILSDLAQKYAIAREVAKANTHYVAIQTLLNGGCVFIYYYLTYSFNRKANMFARPLKLRVGLYSLLGSIVFTTWLFLKDFINYQWEEKGDEIAASISEEYAQGALEFYTKILQRNLALRSLLGDEGQKLYTSLGNDHVVIRVKHVPFVALRDKAAVRCESLKKPKEPEVPISS